MTHNVLLALAGIVMLGVIAQWLAWRLRLPSILLLLLTGIIVGPITGWLDPEALLGDLLFPLVSVSVGIILFEGGLSLRLSEIKETAHTVRNLVSVGVVVTWVVAALGAYWILGFDPALAALLGAILTVTGPTVVLPLLRHVQPRGQVSSVLKWEGIVIDPVGAVLAVLVFEFIIASGVNAGMLAAASGLLRTIVIGGVLGALGAAALVIPLRRYWIPDTLDNAASLAVVVTVFALSDVLQTESGLLTVTVMGVILANQSDVSVRHIVEFKENLRTLLIASLFIVLAARLELSALQALSVESIFFLLVVVFVARPLAVAFSTIGSPLTWRERVFMSWMAPRGIVAAAVSSVFALELAHSGAFPNAEALVSETFLVIVATVALYGLTASHVARWLGLAQPNPQGVLILGAHDWARAMTAVLQEQGFKVLLADSNRRHILRAQMAGLPTYYGNVLADYAVDEIDFDGLGRLLALTRNDEVNSLAALHLADVFGRSGVYQLAPAQTEARAKGEVVPQHLRGRLLFDSEISFRYLEKRFDDGAVIKATPLTEAYGFGALSETYGSDLVPLFIVTPDDTLEVLHAGETREPRAGETLIYLADPLAEPAPQSVAAETETA